MSETLRALAAMDRTLTKLVEQGETLEDKLMIVEFAERRLVQLKIKYQGEAPN
jgi:hypothetical protein